MKFLKSTALALALSAASLSASAAVWTQTIDPNPDVLVPPSVTLNFDLRTVGFNPNADVIDSFTFSFSTRDDIDTGLVRAEWVFADLPGFLADGVWRSTGTRSTNTSLLGNFSLNDDGRLTAVVGSLLGDFIFENATLSATGRPGAVQTDTAVPEPGTLALVALALAGLGLRRRARG